MNPNELKLHRRQILAMIRANPLSVPFQRPTSVTTPGGGKDRTTTTAVPEQTFLLVETGGRGSLEGTISRAEGELLKADLILIGRYDADVEVNDRLSVPGIADMRVYHISPYRTIRTAIGLRLWTGEVVQA